MSNPLDPIVESLRAADPRPEAVDRAVAALRRPRSPRLVPLATGVAALSLLALWPHGSVGMAWAQVADQELPARYHETRVIVAGGRSRTVTEEWIDRSADARRSRVLIFRDFPETGKSVASNPINREYEFIETPRGFYGNQDGFIVFTHKPGAKSKYDPRLSGNVRERTGLERLLADKDIHQREVERNVETRVGRADRYELDSPVFMRDASRRRDRETGRNRFTVYVQPGTKRVLGIDSAGRSGDVWQTTIDYPDHFPAGLFAIPPQGVQAYDLDALNAKVETRLARPIATLRAGGQESILRLVAQDKEKNLWVFWSGARPNGDLAQRVRVLGIANGAAHSSLTYVSKDFGGPHSPFGGHSVQLNRHVDRVDLRIPVFTPGVGRSRYVGDATVRGVSVLQLPFVDGLGSLQRRPVPPGLTVSINAARLRSPGGTRRAVKP